MSKRAKGWLIAAAVLVLIGASLFAAVMTVYRWDFTRLSTAAPETNTYEIKEDFSNILLSTETADILFAKSDDGLCRVVCCEEENMNYSVTVQNDTLTVSASDHREWFEQIGIFFQSPKVTVCLPEAEYKSLSITGSTGSIEIPDAFAFDSADLSLSTGEVAFSAAVSGTVKIAATTGDIRISGSTVGALDLSTSTGEIFVSDVTCEGDITSGVTTGEMKITDVSCRNLSSGGSTGEVFLTHVTAAEKISVERSTGDIVFDGSDAAGLFVRTSTGNVSGSLRSEKIFIAESSTGSVNVPKTVTGGTCEIVTSTGDIRIEIEDR